MYSVSLLRTHVIHRSAHVSHEHTTCRTLLQLRDGVSTNVFPVEGEVALSLSRTRSFLSFLSFSLSLLRTPRTSSPLLYFLFGPVSLVLAAEESRHGVRVLRVYV